VKDSVPLEGPHTGAEREHEEEGSVDMKHCELIATPLPHSSVPLRRRR